MTRKVLSIFICLLTLTVAVCSEKAQQETTSETENAVTESRYNQPRRDLGRDKSVLILS